MSNDKNILPEPTANYEKAELDLLKEALERSSSQRFDKLMQLVKIGFMLKNAKITHKPYNKN